MIFCKFLPHKGTFCWKVPSQNIFTFYLKHQKYPFCAPIFHPLSETESQGKRKKCKKKIKEKNRKKEGEKER